MTPPRLARLRSAPAPPLLVQERAAAHLRFIRDTIERAGSFTAISGRGQVAVGIVGLLAGLVARRQTVPARWLATWLVAAGLGAAIAALAIGRKAARLGTPLVSGPGRRFALAFLTPLAAGGILTAVLYSAGAVGQLPGIWLLLFGTAVVTGGAMSVSVVPVMGGCFIALAVAAFVMPSAWGDALMMAGFGGLHLVFGAYIGVEHGG